MGRECRREGLERWRDPRTPARAIAMRESGERRQKQAHLASPNAKNENSPQARARPAFPGKCFIERSEAGRHRLDARYAPAPPYRRVLLEQAPELGSWRVSS